MHRQIARQRPGVRQSSAALDVQKLKCAPRSPRFIFGTSKSAGADAITLIWP